MKNISYLFIKNRGFLLKSWILIICTIMKNFLVSIKFLELFISQDNSVVKFSIHAFNINN